jgi:hypothetical protein
MSNANADAPPGPETSAERGRYFTIEEGWWFAEPKVSASCLIVEMGLLIRDKDFWANRKRELADFLRRLWTTAASFNYGGPLVAVLQPHTDVEVGEFEQWSADQEWHRGEFALFVAQAAADSGPATRLAGELGSPVTKLQEADELIEERTEVSAERQFLTDVEATIRQLSGDSDWRALAAGWKRVDAVVSSLDKPSTPEPKWFSDSVKRIEEMVSEACDPLAKGGLGLRARLDEAPWPAEEVHA